MSEQIKGIDTSKHQGDQNFAAAADDGMRFAIIKATEGEGYLDPKFIENWEQLVELGHERMYRGAYAFGRPDSVGGMQDGINEAKDFAKALKAVGHYQAGCLPPVLDYEKYSGKGVAANLDYIEGWVKTIEDELGRSPMIYTGSTVWGYQTGNSDRFTHLPLWLVRYSGADYPTSAMEALPWDEYTFWQFSGGDDYANHPPVDGMGSGGEGAKIVDVNYFMGTEEDLAKLAMITPDPDIEDPDPPADRDAMIALLKAAEYDIESGLYKVRTIRRRLEGPC